jgi:hypothetical protein
MYGVAVYLLTIALLEGGVLLVDLDLGTAAARSLHLVAITAGVIVGIKVMRRTAE